MANVITLMRIGLAISLLFIRKYSPLFLILYSNCLYKNDETNRKNEKINPPV